MEENMNRMPMIGDEAPLFIANSTVGPLKLSDYVGKWVVFFSHPGDFTPVCTTEIVSFAKYNDEFERRNCSLLGMSVDSNPSHMAWMKDIEDNMGVRVPFPIISDLDKRISNQYGMIAENVNDTQTIRTVFFIDPNQIVRATISYPMTNGRNISEILRLLDALQITDRENVATPANWVPGLSTIIPSPTNYIELMKNEKNNQKKNCADWYLCFNNGENEFLNKEMDRW